ncbi:MAG: hypothetical protein FWD15_02195 [Alphaproteobacteria bacterium]|nr:hypothetical protein [Alphaproteobacteria bacterium]
MGILKRGQSGASLIELMGYMALASMIVAASLRLYNQSRNRAKQAEFQIMVDDIARKTSDLFLGRSEWPAAISPCTGNNLTCYLADKGVRLQSPFGRLSVHGHPSTNFFYIQIEKINTSECMEAVANSFRRAFCITNNTSASFSPVNPTLIDGRQVNNRTAGACIQNVGDTAHSTACAGIGEPPEINLRFYFRKN